MVASIKCAVGEILDGANLTWKKGPADKSLRSRVDICNSMYKHNTAKERCMPQLIKLFQIVIDKDLS